MFSVNGWSAEKPLSMTEKGRTRTPTMSLYHSLQDWIMKMNNWLQQRRDWTNKRTNIHAVKNPGFATACNWNCHKVLQDLQAQVIRKKAQFPPVPDATLECQAWPGVKLSAMGVSGSTKEWEIAETRLPWQDYLNCIVIYIYRFLHHVTLWVRLVLHSAHTQKQQLVLSVS